MTESQRLAMKGWAILKAHGWPEDAIEHLSKILMEAGFHVCLEQQQAADADKESMIARAQQSFRGNVQ